MDLGRIAIGLIIVFYCLNIYIKRKESKVLIWVFAGWQLAFHSGNMNIFQHFNKPLKLVIGSITMILFIIAVREFIILYKKG
ncbi:hypothetical protein [Anaerosphaera multitolerans]|uniref:Uncharacterized protein n=1 Tax=Anaerosphaera multitolerans TaxID=2487351 RepID=A0A437S5Q8_9FIRM|nr:hypothetical protein [Anaerosphaera multitolerans]RVU54307.1 hypothetical protein EF514_08385 [Anaerosphaera multitolerans]